jgi:hypothetical protein
MRSFNKKIIDAQPIASNNSAAIDAEQLYACSFIAEFSVNDAAGTLKVQVSNDIAPAGNFPTGFVPATTSWIDLTSASVIVAGGSISLVPMPTTLCYRFLRVVWTRTGGTGTITVKMNAQGF